jgi:hypothetical protein
VFELQESTRAPVLTFVRVNYHDAERGHLDEWHVLPPNAPSGFVVTSVCGQNCIDSERITQSAAGWKVNGAMCIKCREYLETGRIADAQNG